MVGRIDNSWVPVTVPQSKPIESQRGMTTEGSTGRKKDVVVLENRKEIKPHARFEKGMFVDIYV